MLVIRNQRRAEIRMIPQVKEIGGEAQILPLGKSKALDQGEIPVRLERSSVDVAAKIAEAGGAVVGVSCALGGV